LKKRKSKLADSRLFGIDVSHYQSPINDWKRVADAGVVFAILKATEASSYKDKNFPGWWPQVKAASIVRGAYHFYRPYSPVDRQVSNFLGAVPKLEPGDLPPVLDLEVPENWRNISLKKRIAGVRQWLDSVEDKLGVKPILYLSSSFPADVLGSDPFMKDYLLWLAHYRVSKPRVPAPWAPEKMWTIWQYSESGKIPGVSGSAVDLNWFNGNAQALSAILVKA
jgi:lysozyme